MGRAFTPAEASVLGVSRDRLKRRDLVAPFHGVRVSADADAAKEPPTQEDEDPWPALKAIATARARAYAAVAGTHVVFSHVTAARLWGFPLPARLERDLRVHVSVKHQSERPQAKGVVAHLMPRDVLGPLRRHGLPVTPPIETFCALAHVLTVPELVGIGDHLVRRIRPDATLEQLDAAVRRSAGRYGARKLREALALVRPRTDSSRETELRLVLVDAGMPEPMVNYPIRDVAGQLIRHGDLAYPELKVLVEYDGEQHRVDDEQYRRDKEQLERIIAAGWLVVHVLKGHMSEPAVIVARVRAARLARS